MRSWSASGSGSSERRGTRAPSCCACARSTPASRLRSPPATRRRASSAASLYPSLAAAYPDLVFDALRARRVRRPRPRVPRPAPRGLAWRSCRSCAEVGCVVDLSADFRLKDAALYPQWYGEAHHRPELLAEFVVRPARAVPRRDRRGRARSPRPGCYPTAASLALAPLVRAGRDRADGHHRRRRQRCVGRRARARSTTPRSAPSTRTSPPTGCSTTGTRPRSSRSIGRRRCCSRRTSRR